MASDPETYPNDYSAIAVFEFLREEREILNLPFDSRAWEDLREVEKTLYRRVARRFDNYMLKQRGEDCDKPLGPTVEDLK